MDFWETCAAEHYVETAFALRRSRRVRAGARSALDDRHTRLQKPEYLPKKSGRLSRASSRVAKPRVPRRRNASAAGWRSKMQERAGFDCERLPESALFTNPELRYAIRERCRPSRSWPHGSSAAASSARRQQQPLCRRRGAGGASAAPDASAAPGRRRRSSPRQLLGRRRHLRRRLDGA